MSKNPNGKAPSQRQLRVGEIVRHALTELLRRGEIPDPLIQKSVLSITEVAMTTDLKKATAYVSALDVKDAEPIIKALNVSAKLIRGRLNPALRQMKHMPAVYFQLDTSFDNYQKIEQLLKEPKVLRDLAQEEFSEE